MIDRDAVGAEGTPFEMRIEAGKIAEFARAVHAQHTAHASDTASVPATFLTSQFFWEERVEGANPWHLANMSQERGMHAEQEYVFHGPPPRAGDTLSACSKVTRIWDKTSRSGRVLTFVEMITEFRDDTGRLVAEAILTGVEPQEAP